MSPGLLNEIEGGVLDQENLLAMEDQLNTNLHQSILKYSPHSDNSAVLLKEPLEPNNEFPWIAGCHPNSVPDIHPLNPL